MGQREFSDKVMITCNSGEMIFKKGQTVKFAAILKSGNVRVRTPYGGFRLQAGDVIGLFDVYEGKYLFDYCAQGDVQLCPIEIVSKEAVGKVLKQDGKYIVLSVLSLAGQMKNLYRSYEILYECVMSTYRRMKISYEKYKNYASKYGVEVPMLKSIDELRPEYEEWKNSDDTMQYINELQNMTFDAVSGMYMKAPIMAEHMIREESSLIIHADTALKAMLEYFKKEIILLSDRGENNLFAGYYKMAAKIREAKGDHTAILTELDTLSAVVDSISDTMENGLGIWIDLEAERLSDMRNELNKKEADAQSETVLHYSNTVSDSVLKKLDDLTTQLLTYAGASDAYREEFIESLTAYRLHQKSGFAKDEARDAIRNFEVNFYELYQSIFFKMENEREERREIPEFVMLFLDYAIVSEQDFAESELLKIYHIAMGNVWNCGYNIFTLSAWLHMIYTNQREPSKNEFDEDYRDSLVQMKKKRTLSQQEEEEYLRDSKRKVQYEIKNMVRLNNRILFASNATFCPYVYGDEFSKDIQKQIMSAKMLSDAVDKIRGIDYSVFYREQIYRIEAPKPENMHIMIQVLPDFILLPNIGSRGSMWQEIGSKRRISPARLVLPMYPMIPVEEMLYTVFGKYRWEFCRTEQGTRWNDITDKSLTSEYYDYVQFYKKSNDLSDAAKMKIKDKLVQCRNNISEVFISDYVAWVRFESQGASRLNRVARELMAQYCPFAKAVRSSLHGNPMFDELLTRKEMKMEKKARELTAHYQNLEKNGVAITEELQEHLEYYKM